MYGYTPVTVIIPAYNEERSLPVVLERIPDFVDRVIVADNGSQDATAAVARRYCAEVYTEPRKGYGAACLRALSECKHDELVVFIDGDGSDDPVHMELLVRPIVNGEYDFVLSDRVHAPVEPGAMSSAQRAGNLLATSLIYLLWGVRMADMAPFRAIKYNDLIKMNMRDRDFGWTVEMQVKAIMQGLRIKEIPFFYTARRYGSSNVSARIGSVCAAGWKIISMIVRLKLVHLQTRVRRKPV